MGGHRNRQLRLEFIVLSPVQLTSTVAVLSRDSGATVNSTKSVLRPCCREPIFVPAGSGLIDKNNLDDVERKENAAKCVSPEVRGRGPPVLLVPFYGVKPHRVGKRGLREFSRTQTWSQTVLLHTKLLTLGPSHANIFKFQRDC